MAAGVLVKIIFKYQYLMLIHQHSLLITSPVSVERAAEPVKIKRGLADCLKSRHYSTS
jgi:hypothetical protein